MKQSKPEHLHRHWLSREQLITGLIVTIAGVLLGGLLEHQFEIFTPRTVLQTYRTPITVTEKALFSADPVAENAISPKTTGSADCWIHSLATHRVDAFRCQAPNHHIDDPCFATYWDTKIIVCPTSPWKNGGSIFRLTAPLPGVIGRELRTPVPSSIESRPAYVWSIVLVNGVKCWKLTGAAMGIENQPIDFVCSNQAQTIGPIDTSSSLWKVTYFSPNSTQGVEIGVARAWF